MKKLLKNKKGETLVETLAAILIFTMASIVLYTMVTQAVGINTKVRRTVETVQEQLVIAEHAVGEENRHESKLNLKFKDSAGVDVVIHEDVYAYMQSAESGTGTLYTYLKK